MPATLGSMRGEGQDRNVRGIFKIMMMNDGDKSMSLVVASSAYLVGCGGIEALGNACKPKGHIPLKAGFGGPYASGGHPEGHSIHSSCSTPLLLLAFRQPRHPLFKFKDPSSSIHLHQAKAFKEGAEQDCFFWGVGWPEDSSKGQGERPGVQSQFLDLRLLTPLH